MLALPLVAVACAPVAVGRAACPAPSLSGYLGTPVVALAANERLRPMRVLGPGQQGEAERAERLTIRADGAGRVAELSCG